VYAKKTKNAKSGKSVMLVLVLYVDDILLACEDVKLIAAEEKKVLAKGFDMVDQGEAHFILGMSIKRDMTKKVLTIDQKRNICQGFLIGSG